MRNDILDGIDVSRMASKLTKREPNAQRDHRFRVVVGNTKKGTTCTLQVGDNQVVADTGTSVHNGDIVTARWRNGRYYVTGNLTSPTTDDEYAENAFGSLVRQVDEIRADTGRFGTLFADTADVYVMVAENATVQQLEAAEAHIAELEAQGLTAAKVNATEATIELLKADSADITELNAGAITVTSETVQKLDAEVATIHDLRADMAKVKSLDVDSLIAAQATIAAMSADTAYIKALTGKTMTTEELEAVNATMTALETGSITAEAAMLAGATIKALLAQSGWFEALTVTGDAAVTGQLKSVLLDGDTARFQNIYANAIKLLGKDGLYHALNFRDMDETTETVYTEVVPDGTEDPSALGWYVLEVVTTYAEVVPDGTENPSELGWYERSGDEGAYVYTLSEDTETDSDAVYYTATTQNVYTPTSDQSAASGTTYYAASERITNPGTRAFAERYGEALDDGLHGSHIIAETITADRLDATSIRSAFLETIRLVLGNRLGFHIEMESDDAGGSLNFVNGAKADPEKAWSHSDNQGNRIAYLQADANGDSLFYMNKAVVVKNLRFSKWEWRPRMVNGSSSNLSLKWTGKVGA